MFGNDVIAMGVIPPRQNGSRLETAMMISNTMLLFFLLHVEANL